MKNILFRAWHKIENKMYAVSALHFNSDKKTFNKRTLATVELIADPFSLSTLKSVDANEVELMQYTGLEDKNGKKMYEGDVIEHEFFGRSEIYFAEGRATFETGHMRMWSVRESQVIGNVYENPELLPAVPAKAHVS
jgi:uncharacterized phage protein (TIGR01671 family)